MEATEHQTQLAPQDSINQHSLSMMKYAIIFFSLRKSLHFLDLSSFMPAHKKVRSSGMADSLALFLQGPAETLL